MVFSNFSISHFNIKRSNYIIKLQFPRRLLSPGFTVLEGGNYWSWILDTVIFIKANSINCLVIHPYTE